jgi:acyl-CoA thioesterase-1
VRVLRAVALVALAAVLTGCGDGVEPAPEPGPSVLVVGDSITGGYYASVPDRAFTALLDDGNVDTVAVPGARAFRVAAAVEEQVVDAYDVVVLEVGANDVGKSTMAEWRSGYRRLLDAVAASSPGADVVCLGPWNAPRPSRRYEAVVRELCADATYLPLSDLYATPGLRGPAGVETSLGASDGFHPNDAGHRAMADLLLGEVLGTG